MAPPSSSKCPRLRIAGLLPLLGILGCQRTIDIASVQDPTWVATTIPYTAVREPTRQFPDYSSIDASILDPKNNTKEPSPKGKTGAPR